MKVIINRRKLYGADSKEFELGENDIDKALAEKFIAKGFAEEVKKKSKAKAEKE